ncbi:MAG: hypothetical protein Q8O00_04580, partial [Holophaga sp.]|nr:hypothetical protein [Holophaga sp.]
MRLTTAAPLTTSPFAMALATATCVPTSLTVSVWHDALLVRGPESLAPTLSVASGHSIALVFQFTALPGLDDLPEFPGYEWENLDIVHDQSFPHGNRNR